MQLNGRANGATDETTVTTNGSVTTNGNGIGSNPIASTSAVTLDGPTNGATTPASTLLPSGLDRRELVRLTLQCLTDAGYPQAARALAAESGYELEDENVTALRRAVQQGNWPEAERLALVVHPNERDANGLRFLIRQQKFLELLEQNQTKRALQVLRSELAPLQHSPERLHLLSSLMMCKDAEDLRTRADWQGTAGESRLHLLSELQVYIPPSTMLPNRRLETLLQQAQEHQRMSCLYHSSDTASFSLLTDHTCSRAAFPGTCSHELASHSDEVWSLAFSHDGKYLATASKDKTIIIWAIADRGRTITALGLLRGHEYGVTCLAWKPDGKTLISAADAAIKIWDVSDPATLNKHDYTISALCWLPDGSTFVSAAMDSKIIFWTSDGTVQFQWRTTGYRVNDAVVSRDGRRLVAVAKHENMLDQPLEAKANGASSSSPPAQGDVRVLVFDVEEKRQDRVFSLRKDVSCLSLSADGRYILVSHSPSELCLYDLDRNGALVRTYTGHSQTTYIIRSCFGGQNENFVISGSEDARVYIWHRETGALIDQLSGHEQGSINSVEWRPSDPATDGDEPLALFASASDDHSVRIWQAEPVED